MKAANTARLTAVAARLRVSGAAGATQDIALMNERYAIGRSSQADIRLDDPMLSRVHCVLTRKDNQWYLEDLNSTNGTWLWGQEVSKKSPLPIGAAFNAGDLRFELVSDTPTDMETKEGAIVAISRGDASETIAMTEDKRLKAIGHFQRLTAGVTDYDRVHDKILEAIMTVSGAENGWLLAYDLEKGEFAVKSRARRDGAEPNDADIRWELVDLTRHRQEAMLSMTRAAADNARQTNGWENVICAPLSGRRQLNGIVYVTAPKFDRDDLTIMNVIGHIGGMAIEYSRLLKFNARNEDLFAAGNIAREMSHHIKNILFGMNGTLGLLKTGRENRDLELIGECLDILSVNHRELSGLMGDFLRFATDREPQFHCQDLAQIVRAATDNFRSQMKTSGIQLDLENPNGRLPLFADIDAEGIYRVMLNLLTNAEKAISEKFHGASGGRVLVTVSADRGGKMARITVEDNGVGLELSQVKALFEGTLDRKIIRGHGIGTRVCRRIVEEHRGHIGASVAQNGGCVVAFDLPLTRREAGCDTIPITKIV